MGLTVTKCLSIHDQTVRPTIVPNAIVTYAAFICGTALCMPAVDRAACNKCREVLGRGNVNLNL